MEGVNVPKACEAFVNFGFASPKSIKLGSILCQHDVRWLQIAMEIRPSSMRLFKSLRDFCRNLQKLIDRS